MTNDKTVTMSRELAQKVDDLLYIMTGHDSYPRLAHKYGKEWWNPINDMRGEICTLLAAPVVERQEPVAWQYRVSAGPATGWSLWHDGKGEEFRNSYQVETRALYTSPPAPVAVVLPEYRKERGDGGASYYIPVGWNACLDELKRLNPSL